MQISVSYYLFDSKTPTTIKIVAMAKEQKWIVCHTDYPSTHESLDAALFPLFIVISQTKKPCYITVTPFGSENPVDFLDVNLQTKNWFALIDEILDILSA